MLTVGDTAIHSYTALQTIWVHNVGLSQGVQ